MASKSKMSLTLCMSRMIKHEHATDIATTPLQDEDIQDCEVKAKTTFYRYDLHSQRGDPGTG